MLESVLVYFEENHLALLATAVTIIFALYQVRKSQVYKSLSYDVEKTRLFTLSDENIGELVISFNGQRVDDPHLIRLTIFSSGNASISASDFERPIKISFPEGAQILSIAVTETQPENVFVDFHAEQNSINLQPTLFNAGDSITLKILLESVTPSLKIDARISGVKNIIQSKFISPIEKQNIKLLFLSYFVLLPLGVILNIDAIETQSKFVALVAPYILYACMIPVLLLRHPGGDLAIPRVIRTLFRRES